MLFHTRLAISCLLSIALAATAAADPIDEAVEKLMAAEGKTKSMTAKFKMVQDMDLGEGDRVKSESEGDVEWMRKDGKKLHRSTMKTTGAQTIGGQEMKLEQTMTMVSDGDFMYSLSEEKGQKSGYKQKAEAELNDSPKAIIDTLKEDYNLKLLPDDKVDGAECYVVEAVSKSPDPDPMVKQTLHFRKDSGLNVKMIGRDKNDKVVFTHTLSDIKLDSSIPADHFVFKAPEGVKMIDVTQDTEPPDKKP